jgi:hypothetical protein
MTLLDAPLAKWKPGSALPPYCTSGCKVKTGWVLSALRSLPQVELVFFAEPRVPDSLTGVIDHEPTKSRSLFCRCSQRHSATAAATAVTATIIFWSFMLLHLQLFIIYLEGGEGYVFWRGKNGGKNFARRVVNP